MMVWKHDGFGEYTVKSGYRALSNKLTKNFTSISPNADVYRDFYKSLWGTYILAKIKIHIWRLMNDLLPHYCNLKRRSLRVEAVCLLCKVDLEDSGHLLWSCSILQSVWASFQIKIPGFEEQSGGKHRFVLNFSSTDD
ncbi:hypothetical protein J1N35_044605 [Gossypium stocksii]|uniref:Reverse transcriptase zinc-binding domain-containing protein n=1 Tax=Gossypium stocksii TaxID=47602 RepID=A0A9D3U9U5_9ROSI|nr:hypothetical protein J1N35_044605 [Gossypium stocksii]